MTTFFQWPGEVGTMQTVYMMRDLVNRAKNNPSIRRRAMGAVDSCGANPICDDLACLNYVKKNLLYRPDKIGLEELYDPLLIDQTLSEGKILPFGDCDDHATFLATLLKSIFHNPKFVIVGRGDKLHHVFVSCHVPVLDSTMETEMPKYPKRAVVFPI